MSKEHVLAIGLTVVFIVILGATIRIQTVEGKARNAEISEMVYFNKAKQQPEPQPEPNRAVPWQLWIIIAIVVIVLFGAVVVARAIIIHGRM